MQSTSVYPLWNWNDIILPFCRLSSTRESFIPSTIKMWNSLNSTIRNVDTLSKFKSELKNIDETENQLYFYGPRKLNIILRPKKKPCVFTVTRKKKEKKNNPDRPTLDFFLHVTVNTHIFFFWPNPAKKFSFFFKLWFISSRNCIWPILSMWSCPWKFKTFLFGLSNILTSRDCVVGRQCHNLRFFFFTGDWNRLLAIFLAPRFPCVNLWIITVYRNKNQ